MSSRAGPGGKAKAKWAQDYGMQTESPKGVSSGRERVEKRKATLGSPIPMPGSPLDKVVKTEGRRRMVPNPLSSPHHLRESQKLERRSTSSPLPKIRGDGSTAMFHGPGVRDSAWHLWDRSDGTSEHRMTYRTFYNTKWGVAVELDVKSFGSFRYTIGDFAKPVLVTRSGVQRQIEAFGAPRLMYELKTRQRVGEVRMSSRREFFGEWVADVVGMTILLSQVDPPNPRGCLQLLLHPDGFIFVGETMSICSLPQSFQVEGGKDPIVCTVEDARARVKREMNVHKSPGFQEMPKGKRAVHSEYRDDAEWGGGEARAAEEDEGSGKKGDWMGSLRRALKSRTVMQRSDENAALEFLKLPADVRLDAVIYVETQKVERDKKNGTIDQEEYEERRATIQDRTTFPAKALRAQDALDLSVFCDKKSKSHRAASEFGGWEKLGWEAKLDAAMLVLKQRHDAEDATARHALLKRSSTRKGAGLVDVIARETEGEKAEVDPDLQREVHRDPQRTELAAGRPIDGFTKKHTEDLSIEAKLWKAKAGKQIRQLYEECDKCGRPCQIAGKGICNRCLAHEKERLEAGVENLTIDPDTFFGDARALLKHPGFKEYKGPPLQNELVMRQKIEPRLLQSSTGDRRGHLENFGEMVPEKPRAQEDRERERAEWQASLDKARLRTRRVMKLDGEDPVTEQEKGDFTSLVRNDRFEAVKVMLMRDMATFAQEPILEARDAHGNTPIIIAAQQGLHKMSKLLVAANCNLNAQNKRGDTALHYAALYGFHSLFDYFKRKGADESLTNHAGKTCYDMEATLLR